MIDKAIYRAPAFLTGTIAFIGKGIDLGEFMTTFAMRERHSFFGGGLNGLCLRFLIPAIKRLFLASSPFAILWLIVAIIVLALKRMHWRGLWPHVGYEISKAVAFRESPSCANGNTTSTPILEILILWICATANHIAPRRIQRMIVYTHEINNIPVTTGSQL